METHFRKMKHVKEVYVHSYGKFESITIKKKYMTKDIRTKDVSFLKRISKKSIISFSLYTYKYIFFPSGN